LRHSLWDSYVIQRRHTNQALTRKTLSNAGKRGAWRRWHREAAIIKLQPLVEKIARDVRWMFSPALDLRDLTQAGNVGLVKAANAYHPALAGTAGFDSYAWFRVRGAIIDSQKRRTYREEANVSLQAIAAGNDGWLPPSLDTDCRPLPDAQAEQREIRRMLSEAIGQLPEMEQRVLRGQLAGQSLAVTARQVGKSVTWTRAKLAEAREAVGVFMRDE
jgi:RNA polymerase sigma factor (sigma-70 family)